ncbi:hypothetical protein [Dyadobacter sandarakinus]|uniref:Lipoprotein n=1 Tax=Dyadobacter sandarakinus TaxID=2747268 RepID=A0ABX7I119_9BACT|nr:hypothetical protein [Dyadobacter sandarakinus]QRQ99755.1 hypothetical protein HWI92_01885 [Dyadobacter sandarakinus]
MTRLLLLITILISFASCSPVLLHSKPELAKIPYGSTKIIASSSKTPDEALSIVSKAFAKEGCPVRTEKEAMQVICEGKSIEGGGMLKALAYIEPRGDSTRITFSGEWGLDATGQAGMSAFGAHGLSGTNKLKWEGVAATKPCVAFQHLLSFSKEVSESPVKFKK